jgi:hypothetical protein
MTVTDYIVELYIKVLILLSCLGWMALAFWGPIYLALKLYDWMQPKQLGPAPIELELCIDCSGWYLLDDQQRCDLCAAIELEMILHEGPGRA